MFFIVYKNINNTYQIWVYSYEPTNENRGSWPLIGFVKTNSKFIDVECGKTDLDINFNSYRWAISALKRFKPVKGIRGSNLNSGGDNNIRLFELKKES